jgi:hypothetical protein
MVKPAESNPKTTVKQESDAKTVEPKVASVKKLVKKATNPETSKQPLASVVVSNEVKPVAADVVKQPKTVKAKAAVSDVAAVVVSNEVKPVAADVVKPPKVVKAAAVSDVASDVVKTPKVVKAKAAVSDVAVVVADVVKTPKTPKTPKVVKAAVVSDVVSVVSDVVKPSSKINTKPVIAKITGINISPAKVKTIISNYVLNKDVYDAVQELKKSSPYSETTLVNEKSVIVEHVGIPVSKMSKKTQDFISVANKEYESSYKMEFAKTKIAALPDDVRTAYNNAKSVARDEHDKNIAEVYLVDTSVFNVEQFNSQYMPDFYKDFVLPKSDSNEWKNSIDKINKLKNRFSTNSRVFISAFVENIIKQLVSTSLVSCVSDNKKIIQLSHILDASKEGFADRFPLYALIENLTTFKQAQAYVKNPQSAKVSEVADAEVAEPQDDSDPEASKRLKNDKSNDIFSLDGVSLEVQYQFRYYVAEICKEIRMDLANTEVDSDGKLMDVYKNTSVSKLFKNFCSTLICEFLMRIGKMLLIEVNARGIKTVNDSIINTVIAHYHTVCNVDKTNTIAFIQEVTSKYYSYVSDRQQKRKDAKTSDSDAVGTSSGITYVE